MSLLKQIVQSHNQQELIDESAAAGATSAGGVAGFRGHFFSPTTSKKKTKKNRKSRMRRRAVPGSSIFHFVESIEDEKFDSADVISKLKKAERKSNDEDDTTGFALEDADGNLVKVFVSTEEAKDFEHALGAALSGDENDDYGGVEGETSQFEIAEILFNLKDRFSIVDVEWPDVEEDEEQEVEGDPTGLGGDEAKGDSEGELDPDLEGGGEEGDMDMEADLQLGDEGELGGGGEGDMTSTLQSVIDLLVSQADAQKAEANAKEAQANAEEAKYNSQAAESKVKKEEEVLDMEAYYDGEKTKDKEAKDLAKLAKWKHETAQKATNELKGEAAEFEMPEKQDEEDNEEFISNKEFVGAWNKPLPGDKVGNRFEAGVDANQDHHLEPGEFIKYLLKHAQKN